MSSSPPFVEKAIPMVAVDEKSGKYVLTQQAIHFFQAIQGNIAVVSVAGLYRTGKSYLLNRVLLNQSNGFGVGPTVNPCTKGLWCWGMPIKGTSNDGQPVNIVVIDTEGIGALDEDQTHDTKIFTLAILASSCFIYNSVGSIDETAIQNLSLVVNLTKHIQLKNQHHDEEGEDPDEISTYFPTFYWVVRDFSLQLQDAEGSPISSKEYLQKALAPQNGFSDDIEEKNRIRRLLTAFFKDRDCFTMIRPLVDETKLQNLDKMDFEELRFEFVQQAMNFRKRIVNSIKPKTLQNKKLNGSLYCSMITSYVQAINDGAVPNIENAWNYMCEQQCRRAMDECYQIFILSIQQTMKDFPRSQEDFNRCTSEAEERAFEAYREKSLGAQASHGFSELKYRIKQKINEMREENIKQSYKDLRAYIVKSASVITKKLNSQQYTSYTEYEKEVSAMGQKFIKQGPKLHNYHFVYLQAVRKLSTQGAEFLFKSFTKQQDKNAEMFREKEKQMSGQIQTLKNQCEALRKRYNETVTETDQKIMELTNRQQTLQKQLDITLQSKKDEQTKMERYFSSKQSDNKTMQMALQAKVADLTNKLDENTRQFVLEQQTWLKEKAIFEQQTKFQLLQIEELQRKEKSLDAAINLSKTNMSKEVRDITMRLQTDRDNMKMQLEAQIEKNNELTEELNTKKEELAEKTDKLDKKEKKFKEDLANAKRDSEKVKKDLQMEKKQLKQDMLNQQMTIREEFQQTQSKFKQSEKALKELNDKFRVTKNDLQKQKSLLEQEMSFIKQQNDSLRSKVSQLKQSHEMALASYQASINQQNQESMSKHIIQMKNEHATEIQRLNHTFESEKNRMTCEFNNLNNKYFQLETKHHGYRTQKELNERELNNIIEQLKMQIASLINDKQKMENEFNEELTTKQSEFDQEKKKFWQQIEDLKSSNIQENQRMNSTSQLQLERVRTLANEEVANAKRKAVEERRRIERQAREQIEQMQKRCEEEKQSLNQQLEEMTQDADRAIKQYQEVVEDLRKNNEGLNTQNAKLTHSYKQAKENAQKKEIQFATRENNLINQFKIDKEKLEERVKQLTDINYQTQRQANQLKHEKDSLVSSLEKKTAQVIEEQNSFKQAEEKFKIENSRMAGKIKQMESEALQKYSNLSKEYALLDQKLQFEVTRTQELQAQMANFTKNSEEKFQIFKNQKEDELKVISNKFTAEKAQIDAKYKNLKVESTEKIEILKKEVIQNTKVNAVLSEKIGHLQNKIQQLQETKLSETMTYRSQMTTIKQALAMKEQQCKDIYKTLNIKIERLQAEKAQVNSVLDRERSLAQQSVNMLNKTKEDNKREAEEKIKMLEAQLAKQQNSRLNDKNALDSNYSRSMSDINSRYQQKIHDLNEALTKSKFELESATKEKDQIIKDLAEKYETQKTTRMFNVTNSERKISDLTTQNKQISEQLERAKRGKDSRENDKLRKEAEEKEMLKKKVTEMEARFKEKLESVRQMQFQFEKERQKWTFERETFYEKMITAQEIINKQAKDIAKANSEKEKLKNTRVSNKTTSFISNMKTVYEPSKNEKSIIVIENNKENTSFQ